MLMIFKRVLNPLVLLFSMKKLILVFCALFAFFMSVQFLTPNIVGTDGYFHIKHARMTRDDGIIKDFPWWQQSVFADGYSDEYFLYHLLLIPFTFLGLGIGAKVSAAFFAAVCGSVFYFVLMKNNIRDAHWWTLIFVFGSESFLYRMMYPRAIPVAVSFLLLYYHFLKNRNLAGQAAVSFLMVWSYPAPYLLFTLLIPAVIFRKSSLLSLPATLIGMVSGFVINPYFPANAKVFFTHGFHMMATTIRGTELAIGTEMKAPAVLLFLQDSFMIFILFGAGAYYGWKRYPELLVAGGFFLLLSFHVMRSVEYAAPLIILFSALSLDRRISFPRLKLENVSIAVLILLFLLLISTSPPRFDEKYHMEQIMYFMHYPPKMHSFLSMIPGYHAVFAVLGFIFGSSLMIMRSMNVVIGLFAAYMFYLASDRPKRIRTYQFLFSPLIFPFMFLVYTDVMSCFLLISCYYAAKRNRLLFAGLLGVLSLLIRQNNIIWLGMIWIIPLIRSHDFRSMIAYIKRSWTFMIAFFGFIVFVILNHGVALGDKKMHPSFSFHYGNLIFFPVLMLILFLPVFIANISSIARFTRKNIILSGIVASVSFIASFTWVSDHPYNQADISLLRNWLMLYLTSGTLPRLLLGIIITFSLLALFSTTFSDRRYYILYPFTFVLLSMTWLIEPRYHLVPVVFFMLFRRMGSGRSEMMQIAYSLLLSIVSIIIFSQTRFFP